MSDQRSSWWRQGVWDGVASPGRFVAEGSEPGIVIKPRHGFSFACVIGKEDDRSLTDYFVSRYGIEPPRTPRIVPGDLLDLIWSGPSQWLAWSRRSVMLAELAAGLTGLAAVTDQTDARALLQVRGARARELLAKGCPVDLHPRAFRRGDTVITAIGGIGVQIWWADVDDVLHLAVPRSMAGSFWSWLFPSAREFGVEVLPPT